MTYLMMRLEWKVFISSKPCRLIVVPRQEFIKHMFGKLLFFFVFPKLGISYKVKNTVLPTKTAHGIFCVFPILHSTTQSSLSLI